MNLVPDLVLIVIFVVIWPRVAWRIEFPRLLAALARGDEAARARSYRRTMLEQWPLAIAAVVVWLRASRPLAALGLTMGTPWRLVSGVAFATVVVLLLRAQRRAIARRPELFAAVRRQLGRIEPMIPRSSDEQGWWIALSVTAGVCEEILYRGYLASFLATWTGTLAGALIATVLFGFGHVYLGRTGAIRAGVVGGVMAAVVALTGSLWTAMLLHAAIDIHSGMLASNAVRVGLAEPATA